MRELEIIVCVKKIPDPEAPPRAVNIDSEAKRVTFTGVAPMINPFDENALEAAIRIKETNGGHVTVLSMGEKKSKQVLSKAFAVGIDKLILINDANLKDLDSYSTAYVLSKAIERIGEYDIIFTGRQAGDWDSGQTGLILAEFLQVPSINLARSVEVEDGELVVEKVKPDGYEVAKTKMPALITASNEIGELRYVSVKQLMEARKKPVEIWNEDDLDIDHQKLRKVEIVDLYKPEIEKECCFIEGESPQEKGENLAMLLVEKDSVISA